MWSLPKYDCWISENPPNWGICGWRILIYLKLLRYFPFLIYSQTLLYADFLINSLALPFTNCHCPCVCLFHFAVVLGYYSVSPWKVAWEWGICSPCCEYCFWEAEWWPGKCLGFRIRQTWFQCCLFLLGTLGKLSYLTFWSLSFSLKNNEYFWYTKIIKNNTMELVYLLLSLRNKIWKVRDNAYKACALPECSLNDSDKILSNVPG